MRLDCGIIDNKINHAYINVDLMVKMASQVSKSALQSKAKTKNSQSWGHDHNRREAVANYLSKYHFFQHNDFTVFGYFAI